MQFKIAAVIVFLSAAAGAFLGLSHLETTPSEAVHEHAKFAVMTNGSRVDMSSGEFQLNARDVHLEANRSHIVHKHAEGVTWERFLQTIPVEIRSSNASDLCVKISSEETCGEGAVVLNGDTSPDLKTEISQDDTLLVIVSTENWEKISEDFMDSELPSAYRPFWLTGQEV